MTKRGGQMGQVQIVWKDDPSENPLQYVFSPIAWPGNHEEKADTTLTSWDVSAGRRWLFPCSSIFSRRALPII
jgi:hypothetical protein